MRIESILPGIRIQGLFADFSYQRYFCKVYDRLSGKY